MQDSQPLTFGVSTLGGGGWLGGVNYILNVVQALVSLPINKRPRICLVVRERELTILDQFSSIFPFIDKLLICGPVQPSEKIVPIKTMEAAFEYIDFLYPILATVLDDPTLPAGSWITDFQHKHLPNFFSRKEIDNRNHSFQDIASKARHVVFSSKTALHDFEKFFPDNHATKHVLRFTSSMDPGLLLLEPNAIAHKHGLNRPYLICCNQFWAHKDHLTAFRAISLLKKSGLDVTLACTGGMNDYRNPNYFPSLLAQVESLDIQNNIIFLGELLRSEQVALIRGSLAMLQPSLFEGWSTVVEDARSLGKTIFLTDIPVHREQNPEYAIYFPAGNAKALAEKVASTYTDLFEIDSGREATTLLEMENRRLRFGLELMNIARQSIAQTSAKQTKSNKFTNVTKSYRVSAIVSTYNSEAHIEGCLQDLICQTLYVKDELEIIIINSASQQNEEIIIKQYALKYPHIVYQRTPERESIYAAWNRGIRLARGQHITNANTDDRHRKDAFEILADALDNDGTIDIVYADQLITEIPNQTFESATPVGKFTWPEFNYETLLEFCCVGPQPMWRKSVHKKYCKFFNENLDVAGDYEFWLSIANNNFKKINMTLGLYYKSKNLTNKEFQNTKVTQSESHKVREEAFHKFTHKLTKQDVINKIEDSISLIFDPCIFLLKEDHSDRIFRYLEHKCWIICMLLEKIGLQGTALDFAQKQIKFFPNFNNIKNYINLSRAKKNVVQEKDFSQLISILTDKDIFYVFPKKEDIQLFLNYQCDQSMLVDRSIYYQEKIKNLIKCNINLEELEHAFFCLIILLCKLNRTSDAKKIATDFYLSFGGSARLSLAFRQALLTPVPVQSVDNNSLPLVSVVIPLYNQGIYLQESVTSVINQSYQNWELIIINDGSTDDSLETAQNLALRYSNQLITILDQTNKGKGFTRNRGVSASSGKYICILDADDMLGSTYLEEAVSCLEKNTETGWITPITLQFGKVHQIFYHFDFDLKDTLTVCPSPISSTFRRALWEEVGGFDEIMVDREDWDFWIKAFECGWTSLHTTTPQFMYRIQEKRFGERSDVNINSKLQIIQRHPWWYKSLPREQLFPLCTQFTTGTFPPDVLNFANVQKMTALPKNRDIRKRLFTQIKDDWMSQKSQSTQPVINPKAASLLRLASHYAEKGDHAKAEKYKSEARKAKNN